MDKSNQPKLISEDPLVMSVHRVGVTAPGEPQPPPEKTNIYLKLVLIISIMLCCCPFIAVLLTWVIPELSRKTKIAITVVASAYTIMWMIVLLLLSVVLYSQ